MVSLRPPGAGGQLPPCRTDHCESAADQPADRVGGSDFIRPGDLYDSPDPLHRLAAKACRYADGVGPFDEPQFIFDAIELYAFELLTTAVAAWGDA